jgi:xylulokinase
VNTVGIDIGTSSVKAVVVTPEGEVIARSRIPHEMQVPAPDLLQHDAEAAWVRGPREALAALGPAGAQAGGIGISAMVPSMCAVDAQGRPLTPGLLYGDARGRVPGLSQANPAGSREAMAFITWCREQEPGAHGYWPAQAVAAVALGGSPVVDWGTAATAWPLFGGQEWDAGQAADLGIRVEQLPTVAGMGEAASTLPSGQVLAPGTVDALGEQIVCEAREPGDVLVMLGTTLMTWALTDGWADHTPLWCIPWHVPGMFAVGGPSNAGGLFMDWVRRLLAPAAATGSAPLPPHGVPVWAPYLRGERVPLHSHDMRGHLVGLDLTHGPEAVRRASYEAAGFVVRDTLQRSGLSPRRIVASGGGTQVLAWVQALADCTGLPVHVSAVQEGGAMGVAWTARMALGLESSIGDASRWAGTREVIEPDPAWAEAVDARWEIFQAAQQAAL